MKHLFQIPIFLLLLWSSGVSYVIRSDVFGKDKIETNAEGSEINASLTVQLIDNIDDETRNKIQFAALVASSGEIGVSIVQAVKATRRLITLHGSKIYARNSAEEIRIALSKKDLQGFDDTWEFVKTHPRGADAWVMIRIAIGNNDDSQFARDLKTLKKVSEMISEGSAFRNKFPVTWQSKIEEALFRNQHLNCQTCTGNFNRGPDMDEFLKDFEFIQLHYDETADIVSRLYAWSKRKYLNGNDIPVEHGHLSEAHQFLNLLRKRNLTQADINKIDGAFFDDLTNSKKFDIELISGPPKYFELKNKDFLSMQNLPVSDADQVVNATGAFSKIDNIDDYEWVAFLRRFGENADPGEAVNTLKNLWIPVFQVRKTEIFANMNPELRTNLQLFSVDDLTNSKIDFILNKILKAE